MEELKSVIIKRKQNNLQQIVCGKQIKTQDLDTSCKRLISSSSSSPKAKNRQKNAMEVSSHHAVVVVVVVAIEGTPLLCECYCLLKYFFIDVCCFPWMISFHLWIWQQQFMCCVCPHPPLAVPSINDEHSERTITITSVCARSLSPSLSYVSSGVCALGVFALALSSSPVTRYVVAIHLLGTLRHANPIPNPMVSYWYSHCRL